jgi:hypothetical protein
VIVYWYTFEPGTGRPLWLLGSGKLGDELVMHSAKGGAINSASNPENVVRERWGTARIYTGDLLQFGIDGCYGVLSLHYAADDPSVGAGVYRMQRLTPRSEAAQSLCNKLYNEP